MDSKNDLEENSGTDFKSNASRRTYYTEDELFHEFGHPRERTSIRHQVSGYVGKKMQCSCDRVIKFITSVIPILGWLPKYSIKENFVGDLIAGFTVGVVHLPQGMAYGLLASLPPIHGLYVSFFPVLMYAILGTCRQVSIGTFAVICIMVGEVVDTHAPDPMCDSGQVSSTNEFTTQSETTSFAYTTDSSSELTCEDSYLQRRIEIGIALCIAVGILQIGMSLFRLGIITLYLSEHLVSGFTCGSAFHVLTSQVSKLIGISVPKYSGIFSLVYTYIDIFKNITDINWATVILSSICIIFLLIGKEINFRFHDKLPFPIPWEFAVVIFTTIASFYGLLNENHDIIVVGDIPTGLRVTVPRATDIGLVMVEAIPIAIVIYAIEISLGKMFALKHSYEIDSNQELLALGSANIFSSFFSCFPCAASLSRSVIWDEVGGKTQVTGLISSSLILVILLWIGPLFESLPQAALAAIIVVNLKRMLRQFEKIGPYWKVCKLDAVTWLVTWAAVVFLGVDIGLLVGVIFEIITVMCNTQIVNGAVLSEVGSTSYYKNVQRYKTSQTSEDKILVFRFDGSLYFANHERFKSQINDAIGYDIVRKATSSPPVQKSQDIERGNFTDEKNGHTNAMNEGIQNESYLHEEVNGNMKAGKTTSIDQASKDQVSNGNEGKHSFQNDIGIGNTYGSVILDMSACSFVDNDGAKTIKGTFTSLRALKIPLLLSACNEQVRKSICSVCKETRPAFFISLDGAMEFARFEDISEMDETGNIVRKTSNFTRSVRL